MGFFDSFINTPTAQIDNPNSAVITPVAPANGVSLPLPGSPNAGIGLNPRIDTSQNGGVGIDDGSGGIPKSIATSAIPASTGNARADAIAQMSTGQKILAALSEFGAGMEGKPSPLAAKLKAQQDATKDAQQAQYAKSQNDHLALEDIDTATKARDGLSGDALKNFDAAMQTKFDARGVGDIWKAHTQNPDLSANFGKILPTLSPMLQTLYQSDPKSFLKIMSSPDGIKMAQSGLDSANIAHAGQQAYSIMTHFNKLDLPPDIVAEANSANGKMTPQLFRKVNDALPDQIQDPSGSGQMIDNPQKISDKTWETINADKVEAKAFWNNLGMQSPSDMAGVTEAGAKKAAEAAATPDTDTSFMKEAAAMYGKGTSAYNKAVTAHIARSDSPTSVMVNSGSDSTLSKDDLNFMAQQYLAGDKSVLQNLGRGTQGAKNIALLRGEITQQMKDAGLTGKDSAAKMAEFAGLTAAQRTVGTRSANVEMAADEANKIIPLARSASAAVPRSGFLPFGKANIMFDENTNDPAYRKFAAANNALVNVYSRAISPTGQPTLADKEHARAILSTAHDQDSYNATLDQMQQEISAAQSAPQHTRQAFSNAVTGRRNADKAPAGVTVSNW